MLGAKDTVTPITSYHIFIFFCSNLILCSPGQFLYCFPEIILLHQLFSLPFNKHLIFVSKERLLCCERQQDSWWFMSNETALGGGQFMCLTCSVPLYHNYTSLSPVDGLKQKSDDRSFSYNYSDLFIESVLCDRRGIRRVKQLAWVPCIHCMNELEITVLMSNNIPHSSCWFKI